jgi:hypothetical protein
MVHIWKSFDSGGSYFLLRLTPLYASARHGAIESFPSEGSLSRRMDQIGLGRSGVSMSLSNLRLGDNAIWSNCEVAEGVFDSFGQFV